MSNTEQRNDSVCICGEPDCRLWMEHGFSSQPPASSPLEGEVPPMPDEEFDPVRFGANVLSMMEQRGLTCRSAAEETGVSHATINRVTRGNMPDVPTYLRLMKWLGSRRPAALSTKAGSGEDGRITKEWCLNMAALEDGEIGAGMPDHPLRAAIAEAGKPASLDKAMREATHAGLEHRYFPAPSLGTRCKKCGTFAPASFAKDCNRPECEYRTGEPASKMLAGLSQSEGELPTNWQPIDTAPRDGTPFIAALWVKHTNGRSWQETHVVWCDDETGEIDSACDQGWSRVDDYVAWMPVPDLPPIEESR